MITIDEMKGYLRTSLSSLNDNKIRGLLAEYRLIEELRRIGYSDRVAPGGWIVRNSHSEYFAHHTAVLIPRVISPDNYDENQVDTPIGLHTICATMHQLGIRSYFCIPKILKNQTSISMEWNLKQLGVPYDSVLLKIENAFPDFKLRDRMYNFLRYKSDVSNLPKECIISEFSKENLRVSFQNLYMSEMSDIDGIFWGQNLTYPIEIKEKTRAHDNKVGDYFGLDAGPFVKLAFYAAKKQNMHSLFFVREVNEAREFVNWWYISFENIAQFASWLPRGGGISMTGGSSHVIMIPASEFSELNKHNLSLL